jgi:hypothetical protein
MSTKSGQARRADYQTRKSAGLCVDRGCKALAVSGRVRCRPHLDRIAAAVAKRCAQVRAASMCPSHPNRSVAEGYKSCIECVTTQRARSRGVVLALKRADRCVKCRAALQEGDTAWWCRTCADAFNEMMAILRSTGCCKECRGSRAQDGTTWRCRPCADKHNVQEAERRQSAKR